MKWYLREALIIGIFLAGLVAAFAEKPEDLSKRLEEINTKVSEESQRLQSIRVDRAQIEAPLRSTESQIDSLEKRESKMLDDLALLRGRESEVQNERDRIAGELNDLSAISNARVRVAYVYNHLEKVNTLHFISQVSLQEAKYLFYLKKLRGFDESVLAKLSSLELEFQAKSRLLKTLSEQKEALLNELSAQRQVLEKAYKKQQSLSIAFRVQEESLRKSLNVLRVEALRLEVLMRSVMSQHDINQDKSSPAPLGAESRHAPLGGEMALAAPFDGPGLDAQKGSLELPVENGKVLRPFGGTGEPSFDDFVFRKGIEMEAEPGKDIKSVADGQVMFVGKLPAYGSVVIVDHGKRTYSLYGQLEPALVKFGERIARASVVGRTGAKPTSAENGNFHFEIRKNDKAVDPSRYLKK